MSVFFDIQRLETIEKVKFNLRKYVELSLYGIPTVVERVPSTTTSLIKVSSNKSLKTYDSVLIEAITEEENDKKLVKKYNFMIQALEEVEQQMIYCYFFKKYTTTKIKHLVDSLGNSHPEVYLERAYIKLALLDEDIDYSLKDYIIWKCKCKSREKGQDDKKLAIIILEQLFNDDIPDNKFDLDMYQMKLLLSKLPDDERNILVKYFSRNEEITKYQYRQVKRAILSFMYMCDYFDFGLDEFKTELEKTGNGWKRCFTEITTNLACNEMHNYM